LLRWPSFVKVDARLEKLVVLVRSAYPHAATSSILTLAQALNIAAVEAQGFPEPDRIPFQVQKVF
jgi:hypothetical protein